MTLDRRTFTGRRAALDFTLMVPAGFVEAESPAKTCDFRDPDVYAPLLVLASPVKGIGISIAARPAASEGTVREMFQLYCTGREIRLLSIGPTYVGGLRKNHPAIIATGLQGGDDTEMVMSFIAIEDGGRFVVAQAMCTRKQEPRHMSMLEKSIYSLELHYHKGPTAQLEDNGATYAIEILQDEPLATEPECRW
jgi:hypothetical protein